MKLITITAEVADETAGFFQKYGADMGISANVVLNRLLQRASGNTPVEVVNLVSWYFNALTDRKSTEEQLEVLHIFSVLCISISDGYIPNKQLKQGSETELTPLHQTFNSFDSQTLKSDIVNNMAMILNQYMPDDYATQGSAIDKIIDEFTNMETLMIPYHLVNYLFASAKTLDSVQAKRAVNLTVENCIDRIHNISGISVEKTKQLLTELYRQCTSDKNVMENIALIKSTRFYREKIKNE